MKTLLIFPAQWYPTQPYLSTPYLTAYLRSKGWEVAQRDFNIESYDDSLSPDRLQKAVQKMERRREAIRANKSFSFKEKSLLDVLSTGIRLSGPILDQIEEAKSVLRTPERFFDFQAYQQADLIIKSALKLISDAYAPSIFSLSTFESGTRAEESISKAQKMTRDRETNPFIELYEEVLLPTERWEDYDVVGLSIVGISQILPGLTLARMLKEKYNHLHIVLGGPIFSVNATQLPGHPEFFDDFCHSIITFEGEEPLHRLLTALKEGRPRAEVPNLIYAEDGEVVLNRERVELRFEDMPAPTFEGLPMERYFSPVPILPVLQSRGCYWGKCTFCDHGAGYIDQYRAKHADRIIEELAELKAKYKAKHFLFTDESFPPALFKKLPPMMIEADLDIFWTTLIRFESSLIDPELWEIAAQSGCRSLYFGLESANERIIQLVKKDTKIDVAIKNLKEAKRVGIWSHVMGFFGFPSETQAEAEDTRRFLIDHHDLIHSVEMYFFVLYKHAPVWDMMEETRIQVQENPDHDLALDYYYTPESGLTIPEAMERYQNFYRDDFDPWALRVNAREHVFLYITHFGTNDLPQLYVKNHPESQQEQAFPAMM